MPRSRRDGRRRRQRATRTSQRVARALISAVGVLVVAALGALGWLMIVYPAQRAPGRGREVRLEGLDRVSAEELVAELHRREVVTEPRIFLVYLRLLDAPASMRSGEVLLTDDMSPRDVLQRITDGFGDATVRLTIPEGFDRFQVAERLDRWGVCDAPDFVAATEDTELLAELEIPAATAEGYLFPDTYRLSENLGAEETVRRFVANWRRRAGRVLERRERERAWFTEHLAWGRHEVLTLASIVEKEAAVAEERSTIARVFINRMISPDFRPRRLQADPTVSYGCRARPTDAPSCATFERSITRAMLRDRANLYNTYRHEGLPPGPICNPGAATIEAVLTAEPHGFLYFVARGGGRHTFSVTLAEHNVAVQRYRRR